MTYTDDEPFYLPPDSLQEIGRQIQAAGKALPAVFGRRFPNIVTQRDYMIAEDWCLVMQFAMLPELREYLHDSGLDVLSAAERQTLDLILKQALDETTKSRIDYCAGGRDASPIEVLLNWGHLVRIMELCTQVTISAEDKRKIRESSTLFIRGYERIYYHRDLDHISACLSVVHRPAHVSDDIDATGPSWVGWEWSMERACKRVRNVLMSKRKPYEQLTNAVLALEEARCVAFRHNLSVESVAVQPNTNVVKINRMDGPTIELLGPFCVDTFGDLSYEYKQCIKAFLKLSLGKLESWKSLTDDISAIRIERWSKIVLEPGHPKVAIAAEDSISNFARESGRERSFVKYFHSDEATTHFTYGLLRSLIVVDLPERVAIEFGRTRIALALVFEAKWKPDEFLGDELISFRQLSRLSAENLGVLDSLVGALPFGTRGLRYIADQALRSDVRVRNYADDQNADVEVQQMEDGEG